LLVTASEEISEVPTAIHRGAGSSLSLSLFLILKLKNNQEEKAIVMPKQDMQQPELRLTSVSKGSELGGSNKLAMSSAKASAVTAARMLDFVREISLGGEDISQRQSDYWIFVLKDYSPLQIERAFHQWVRRSKHMPVPSEILAILEASLEAERQDASAAETRRYVAELQETRQRLAQAGLPYGDAQYHGLMKEVMEVVHRFPLLPHPHRIPTLRERLERTQPAQAERRKPAAKVEGRPEAGRRNPSR
jgi:hypothetical protein